MLWTSIRQFWAEKRWYRIILSAASAYALLRLLLHVLLIAGAFSPAQTTETTFLPDDLRIYLDAAQAVQNQQPLYPPLPLERMEFYQYAPSFALAFTPFLAFSSITNALIHTLLHVVTYGLLYVVWGRIFAGLHMDSAVRTQALLLPAWLIYSPFWSDLNYLNVYVLMALMASLLIQVILTQKLGWSVILLTVILQIKPQWAFAALLPLIIGQYRFFFRQIGLSAAAYAACTLVTIVLIGSDYGLGQYATYFNLLVGIGGNYPWRTPDLAFLGYNHSIVQTVVYLFNVSPESLRLALVIKSLIVLPLALFGLLTLVRPARVFNGYMKLLLVFSLYTAAFIWLDVVWELTLSIAVFTLLAAIHRGWLRSLIWVIFVPYMLVDAIQVMSYVIFGDSVLAPGPYVLTDPSIYLPLTLITTVVFYGLLTMRLWASFDWQKQRNTLHGSEHFSRTTH